MPDRRAPRGRRRILALVLAPTIAVGLALAAVVVVDARAKQADVDRADAVAERYEQQVSAFRDDLARDLERTDATDPRRVARVLDRYRDDVPTLGDAPQQGAAGSADYGSARSEQAQLSEGLDRLDAVVADARRATTFVRAARRAISLDPGSLAPGTVVTSGAPLRTQLLPPVRTALAEFEAVEAPEDAAEARTAVREALQHVITEAERLAAQLDAGQSGSFQYAQQYVAARTAVEQYDEGVSADLSEALANVLGSQAPAR